MAKLIKRPEAGRGSPPHEPGTEPAGAHDASHPGGTDGEDTSPELSPQEAEEAEARVDAASIRQDAQTAAEALLTEARAEADRIVAEAKEAGKQAKEHSQQEGHEAGRQEGLEAFMKAALKLGQAIEGLQATFAPEIVTLSMAIARRILGRELEFAPETVVQIVKQALADKARQRREITLRVHPDDIAVVREHKAELTELLSRSKEIAIQEDADVARHGVIIETEAGIIDAQLDVQLGALERALKQVEEEG